MENDRDFMDAMLFVLCRRDTAALKNKTPPVTAHSACLKL